MVKQEQKIENINGFNLYKGKKTRRYLRLDCVMYANAEALEYILRVLGSLLPN